MKKIPLIKLLIISGLIVIIFILVFQFLPGIIKGKPNIGELSAGVVKIESPLGTGSGFIVDKRGFIVTNSHVIGGDAPQISSLKIIMYDYRVYDEEEIGLVYNNPDLDLALLFVKPKTIKKYPCFLFDELTKPYEDIIALGYPFGNFNTASGKITMYEQIIKDRSFLPIDAILDQGYSGGPIINYKGKAIGVAKMIRGRGQTFAIPIKYVRYLFEEEYNKYTIKKLYDLNIDDTLMKDSHDFSFHYNFQEMDYQDLENSFEMAPFNSWKIRGISGYYYYVPVIGNRLYFYKIGEYPKSIDVTASDQEGIILTKKNFSNFLLETNFQFKHRLDGFLNIDVGIIFRYQDPNHYYRYSTYSGVRIDEEEVLYKQDLGGIWGKNNDYEECEALSNLMKTFENYRTYNVKIFAIDNKFTIYVDNMKCLEWSDYDPNYFRSGKIGFRVVSGLAEFYDLKICEL